MSGKVCLRQVGGIFGFYCLRRPLCLFCRGITVDNRPHLLRVSLFLVLIIVGKIAAFAVFTKLIFIFLLPPPPNSPSGFPYSGPYCVCTIYIRASF